MFAVLCALLVLRVPVAADVHALNCSQVKDAFTALGLSPVISFPAEETSGADLQVCAAPRSCCNPEMEQIFRNRSSRDFQKLMDDTSEEMRNTFMSAHQRLDGLVLDLLESTERSLNEMFLRTYGKPYLQNAEVFQKLFSELRRYYTAGGVHLEDMLSDFWSRLLERMFALLNSQYLLTEDYLECVGKLTEKLKPFGDVPKKMKTQVTRAFVSARAFVQGLAVGRDVADRVSEVSMSAVCVSGFTRMLYCSQCVALPTLKPCSEYCLQLMKTCLADRAELDPDWTRYTDAMLLVTERLEGPFNIESVMEPVDVKISEAIMNMQENSMQISYQVFQGCGQPNPSGMSRSSRSAPNTFVFIPDSHEDLTHLTHTHSHTHHEDLPTATTGSRLQRLVTEVKEKLKRFRRFWASVPESICQEEHAAAAENENCWNGLERGGFDPEVQRDAWVLEEKNSTDAVVRRHIVALRMMSNKLKNAYHGTDLHFQDSVSDEESSGSGSGSGVTESDSFRTDPTHTPVQENRDETSSASSVRPEVLLLFFSALAVR
ncbi:glypican-6b [Pimephales promelas]|uniref:glypican-6b n=1 Tax=Pimephales promelas TaxID=90988 RepID=UPI00195583C6|nr:glypican-6b [Pimephales promelas]KAG1927404.1 glypican-6 [Pimephales promelas]